MSIPSVLARILETKASEISAGKSALSMQELQSRAGDMASTRGFIRAVEDKTGAGPAIIAEIKKASPSAGVIREHFVPADIAASYEAAGAACLSVLTDEQYFQGHADYLAQARAACSLPALRKDFIIDPWQIYESRCMGADCILLIVAALELDRMQELHGLALDAGLDVLVESHDETEFEQALTLPGALQGVNNRDLHVFRTSLDTSVRLKEQLPDERILVAESGIRTREDVQYLRDAGINTFLVGEAFMREDDPGAALSRLFFPDSP